MWILFSIACIYPNKFRTAFQHQQTFAYVCFNLNKQQYRISECSTIACLPSPFVFPFLQTTVSVLLRCGVQSDTTTNLQEMSLFPPSSTPHMAASQYLNTHLEGEKQSAFQCNGAVVEREK